MDYKLAIAEALSPAAGMPAGELAAMLETPPNPAMGNFALPCFKLAKVLRKAPPAIAAGLAQGEFPSWVSKVEVQGGYLNFFLDGGQFAQRDPLRRAGAGRTLWLRPGGRR